MSARYFVAYPITDAAGKPFEDCMSVEPRVYPSHRAAAAELVRRVESMAYRPAYLPVVLVDLASVVSDPDALDEALQNDAAVRQMFDIVRDQQARMGGQG